MDIKRKVKKIGSVFPMLNLPVTALIRIY